MNSTMSEHHKTAETPSGAPRHSDVSFEERDIKVGTIYWYLIALALATVIALIVCIFILRFTSNLAASSDAPPPPSRAAFTVSSASVSYWVPESRETGRRRLKRFLSGFQNVSVH